MHKSISDILDILLTVLVLSVGFILGYTTLASTEKEVQEWTSTYQDKNTSERYDGVKEIYDKYGYTLYEADGTLVNYNAIMTKGDVLIMTQIQDSGLAGDQVISLDGRKNITTISSSNPLPVSMIDENGSPIVMNPLPNKFVTTGEVTITTTRNDPVTYAPQTTNEKVQAGHNYDIQAGDMVYIAGELGPDTNTQYHTSKGILKNVKMIFTDSATISTTESGMISDIDVRSSWLEDKANVKNAVLSGVKKDKYDTLYQISYDANTRKFVITPRT